MAKAVLFPKRERVERSERRERESEGNRNKSLKDSVSRRFFILEPILCRFVAVAAAVVVAVAATAVAVGV